jgi:cell division transport system ATP-binding protein
MICFSHVYKTFRGEVHALRDVTFNINKGDFVFLTGHSGAGKTTLFNLLAGFDKATSGRVTVANYNLEDLKDELVPYFRRKVGVVFQDFKLLSNRTVAQNIVLPLEIVGASQAMIHEKCNQMLTSLGIADKANQYPDELSGGEKQRVAIGRALISQPEVIIADEPTGNLDPHLSREVMNVFLKFNSLGTTVFIATHDQGLVKDMQKRVIQLSKGELADEASA